MNASCQQCGAELEGDSRFCGKCGAVTAAPEPARRGRSPGSVIGIAALLVAALAGGGYWAWTRPAGSAAAAPQTPARARGVVTETPVTVPARVPPAATAVGTPASPVAAAPTRPAAPAPALPRIDPVTPARVESAPPLRTTFTPPPAIPPAVPPVVQTPPPAVFTPAVGAEAPVKPVPPPYRGPMAGTLTYSGPPVVQHGEIVFRGLPPTRLRLDYDTQTWEAELSPDERNTQRLILRSRKPGTQKNCVVRWTVIP